MQYHFPVVIIDEHYNAQNASGLGIRGLAQALEALGMEVTAATAYSDMANIAAHASRASAFIVGLVDADFPKAGKENDTVHELRDFVRKVRVCSPDVPIFLYGETKSAAAVPNDVTRELHGFIHMFEDTPDLWHATSPGKPGNI